MPLAASTSLLTALWPKVSSLVSFMVLNPEKSGLLRVLEGRGDGISSIGSQNENLLTSIVFESLTHIRSENAKECLDILFGKEFFAFTSTDRIALECWPKKPKPDKRWVIPDLIIDVTGTKNNRFIFEIKVNANFGNNQALDQWRHCRRGDDNVHVFIVKNVEKTKIHLSNEIRKAATTESSEFAKHWLEHQIILSWTQLSANLKSFSIGSREYQWTKDLNLAISAILAKKPKTKRTWSILKNPKTKKSHPRKTSFCNPSKARKNSLTTEPTLEEILVISHLKNPSEARTIARWHKKGDLRRICERVYTSNLVDNIADIIKRNVWNIVPHLFPNAVATFRTATTLQPYIPDNSDTGFIFITGSYASRNIVLPGLTIKLINGPPPMPSDRPFVTEHFFIASSTRCLMENLKQSRVRSDVRRSAPLSEIISSLQRLFCVGGVKEFDFLLDQAKSLSKNLGTEKEFAQLREIMADITNASKAASSSAGQKASQGLFI